MTVDPRRQREALLKRFQEAFERYHALNSAIWEKYQSSADTPTHSEWDAVSKALAAMKTLQDRIAELDRRIEKPKRR